MTQTHYEKNTLEQVVRSSHLILVVQKLDPFVSYEKVSILPEKSVFFGKNDPPYYEPPYHDPEADKNQTEKNYPPYTRTVHHFKVVEELFNTTEESLTGQSIQVLQADVGSRLSLHKMYYLEGRRKSPIYQSYGSSLQVEDFENSKSLIVFLNSFLGTFEYSLQNSYEGLEKQRVVIDLIKQLHN